MSNDIIRYGEGDPFAAYAAHMGSAPLLKFAKGDFALGENAEEVPEGTQFVANMDELRIGWIRWENDKPAEELMGRLIDRPRVPHREELGYEERSQWEPGADGPRDPWQLTNTLPLVKVNDGTECKFTTSSRGGINAIAKLSGQYSRVRAKHANEWPIISLEVGSYQHDRYGKIKFPIFRIAGWHPKDGAAETPADNNGPPPVPMSELEPVGVSNAAPDDEIPF
jgi:hypothetical protein